MNQSYSNSKNGKTLTIPAWRARITMSLRGTRNNEEITIEDVVNRLGEIQNILMKRDYLYLSANTFPSAIFLGDGGESAINFNFENNPKFPETNSRLRDGVLEIADYLMTKFEKNDIIIVFEDEAVMLQNSTQHYRNSKEYKRACLSRYRKLTDDDLAEQINTHVGIRYFNFYIQGSMGAIQAELIRREIDLSNMGDDKGMSYARKVKIIDGKMIQI